MLKIRYFFIFFALSLAVGSFLIIVSPIQAAAITVETENDNLNTDGLCSLREALRLVNGNPANADCPATTAPISIVFDGSVETITISAALGELPALTASNIVIDGLTNDTFSIPTGRTLDGSQLASGSGLTIEGSGNTIFGFGIVSFPDDGLVIHGSNNTISDIWVGENDANLILDAALANDGNGIVIENGAQDNVIQRGGGLSNVIVNNGLAGIVIRGTGTDNNVISGSLIGNHPTLISPQAPNANGVIVSGGAANNIIGTAAQPNQIEYNTVTGVDISNADSNRVTNNDSISSNGIGVRLRGGAASNTVLNNTILNNTTGILITGGATTGNTVNANIINNNASAGIRLANSANNNRIRSNNPISNNFNGIVIIGDNTSNNLIRDNTIENNLDDGIVMSGNNAGNQLLSNFISNNGTTAQHLGIDLVGVDGVNTNDANDLDTGPNQLHNFPVLDAIITVTDDNGTVTRARIDIVAGSGAPVAVEFFSNGAFDPGGFGEGETPLFVMGGIANGVNQFISLSNTIAGGTLVTSTSTDTQSNTSEFSNGVIVGALIPDFSWLPAIVVAPTPVNFTDLTTNTAGGSLTWAWDFQNDGITDSTLQNPTFTFTTAGTYTVRLTVTHSSGISGTVTQIIVVTGQTATFTPTPITPTATLTFTNTATFTPVTPTATSTATSTQTATSTRTLTATPSATNTSTLTRTPTQTRTPLPTSTHTPVPTNTDTPLPTSTHTPVPTNTPSPIPTNTATPVPNVTIDKRPDDDDSFTIIIDNQGDDLTDVVVEERLQEGVYYVSSVPGRPLCNEVGGVISCTLGTIQSGTTATVQINVDTEGVDIISGQTSVSSGGRTLVTVDEPYITKVNQPPFAAPGDTLTYIIRVINPTTRTITAVTVTDTMPEAITIESADSTSGRVQVTGQDIRFTQANLAAGERITITLTGKLKEGQTMPQIVNRACLTTSTTVRPRCAVAGFFRATQLPSTGESGRPALIVGVVAVIVIGAVALFGLRRRVTR